MHPSPETSPQLSTTGSSDAAPVKADLNQMFVLIEGILPFEACLYYQVMPLSIEGSCLNLGMVNLSDQAAADYVRRLVSYINCSIVPRQIASDWHREILSKFLSHSTKSRSSTPPSPATTQTKPSKAASPPPKPKPTRQPQHPPQANAPKPTPPAADRPTPLKTSHPLLPFAEQPTLVVNAPESLTPTTHTPTPHTQNSPEPHGFSVSSSTYTSSGDSAPPPTAPNQPSPPPAAATSQPRSPRRQAASMATANALPSLQHLPPKALTEALLDRVIDEGIGRLYLERQAQTGRILWSRDGVLQSVLEQIDLQVFQGVINELKLMVSLSLIPARKPRQVEIERLHRGQPILLRFRLIPGNQGEEATLQVLRGAALKFYQQQQIEKMGRDALGVAQTLKQRLNEIRRQARQSLPTEPVPNETLPTIIEMLKDMEQQVHEMMRSSDS